MDYLNEDGSLNMEAINTLPYKEHAALMEQLTAEQFDEYIERTEWVDMDEALENIREKNGASTVSNLR